MYMYVYIYIHLALSCFDLCTCIQVHDAVLSITCSIKRELEKATSEKTEIHRHYIMVCTVYVFVCNYM